MAIDLFSTRTMLQMVEDRRRASTWLRDTFFGNVQAFETKYVDYDYEETSQELAQFSSPRIGGTEVTREGFKTYTVTPPELAPLRVTDAEDLLTRLPGEHIYNQRSPQERAAEQLGRDLAKLDDIISRREEWMCAEALLTGGITIQGAGVNDEALYWSTRNGGTGDPFKALTGTAAWSDAANATPLTDLHDAAREIIKGSGINPSMAVLGADALDALINTDQVQKYLENRRVDFGNLAWPEALPNGVRYWGHLAGLDIFTYEQYYVENGVEAPIFDPEKVLIGSSEVPTMMAYGACSIFAEGQAPQIYAAPRVPDSYCQRKNPAGRIVQIKSRPLPVIQQKRGFYVLQAI